MMVKLKEGYNQARQEDVQQQIMQRSASVLRRIIAIVQGQGGRSHCRVCDLTATSSHSRTTSGGSRTMTMARTGRRSAPGGAHAAASTR